MPLLRSYAVILISPVACLLRTPGRPLYEVFAVTVRGSSSWDEQCKNDGHERLLITGIKSVSRVDDSCCLRRKFDWCSEDANCAAKKVSR